MEVVLLKTMIAGLSGLTLKTILDKYREAEEQLQLRKMSWQQFEIIRSATIGAGMSIFALAVFLLVP